MKTILLYDWEDKVLAHAVREVRVQRLDDLTRNGVKRFFAWSDGEEEFNFMLYPGGEHGDGVAYPEYDNRVQQQRYAERYIYVAAE